LHKKDTRDAKKIASERLKVLSVSHCKMGKVLLPYGRKQKLSHKKSNYRQQRCSKPKKVEGDRRQITASPISII
jgi:hypothetical protein